MAPGSEHLEWEQKGMAAYRASHLAQSHKARQAFRDAYDGKIPPLVAYFCCTPLSRTISQLGADLAILDWEHISIGLESMTTWAHEIQFMSEGRTIPIIRIPNHDHAFIGWALDTGASIMVPQVDTVEQAEKVVSATKFGRAYKHARSAPPGRLFPGVANLPEDPSKSVWANQNRQAAVIIQMESAHAASNLDDILTAVGKDIDGVFMGSLDMRVDLGLEGAWGEEKEFLDIVEKITETCKKHKMPFGNPVLGKNWGRAEGRTFGVVGLDIVTLWGDRDVITEARGVFKSLEAPSKTSG